VSLDLEALRAELITTQRVSTAAGKGFDVAGLSLDVILRLFRRHASAFNGLFDQLMQKAGDGPAISLQQADWLGGALLAATPRIAAEIIAEAAGHGSPEAADLYQLLPAPVQLDALDKIAALTFTSEMPPKKVMEIVARILGGVNQTLIGNEQALPA